MEIPLVGLKIHIGTQYNQYLMFRSAWINRNNAGKIKTHDANVTFESNNFNPSIYKLHHIDAKRLMC